MDRQLFVYLDLSGQSVLVGRLWTRMRRGNESATFEYDREWLAHPFSFSLEPALTLGSGPHHTQAGRALFGALGDSAPDRWGRVLMRRAERRRADHEKRQARTLTEADFLMMVDDEARMGALRFAESEGGPLGENRSGGKRIPPFIELPRLLSATERVLSEKDTDEDIRLLLAPGSSLGGARPKAAVRDRDGTLAIAKFPQKTDEMRTVLWEALALELAGKAGIVVPPWRLETLAGKPVLVLRRFDRAGATRIPFLSAMSMLGAADLETHSYLEIADAISQYGAEPKEDLRQLWRRIVFNVLISNTDDHLRNHAFLFEGNRGWRLSPAYDLNPVPVEFKPRILTTLIDGEDGTASMELVHSVARYFGVSPADGRKIAAEVGRVVKQWRKAAAKLGLRNAEIDRMASAFEHGGGSGGKRQGAVMAMAN